MRSSLAVTLSVLSMLAAAPSDARAQDPPGEPVGERADLAEQESGAGREATLRGRVLFDEGDFRGAALEYERAIQLLPPGRRRNAALNNLAVCHERSHAYDEALGVYERYLREADPSPDDRAEVERIVRGLRDLLAELVVTSDAPASVWVDERARGQTPLTLQLTAGAHVVEVRAPGRLSVRKSVSLRARSLEELHVPLAREERYRGAPRGYVYGGFGLTAAALVVGGGLGIRALTLHDDASERAELGTATAGDETRVRRLSMAADISFGAAALLGASSLVLAFLTDWSKPSGSQASARTTSVRLVPLTREHGALVMVGGAL